MQFKYFTIPVRDPAEAEESMNRFLRGHRVLSVRQELVTDGRDSYWTVNVEYLEGSNQHLKPDFKTRVDYKEILNEQEFACFSRLRDLRKKIAETEGLPVFAVFTNDQLAKMVTQKFGGPQSQDKKLPNLSWCFSSLR